MPRSPLADLLAVTAAAAIVPAALLAASSPALEVDGAADQRRTARHFSALVPTLLDARSARSAHETGRAAAGPGAEGVTLALMVASVAELLDALTPSMPPGSAAAAPGGARAAVWTSPAAGVAGVQRGLIRLGYATGPVDGRAGPLTRAAVRAFQGDVGLPVDGEPSAALLARLQAAGGAGGPPAAGREERHRGRDGGGRVGARPRVSAGGGSVFGELLAITSDDELTAIVAQGKSGSLGP
jgi:Putative peptidoglycan binding domain